MKLNLIIRRLPQYCMAGGVALGLLVVPPLDAQVAEPPPVPESLRNRVVPEPSNLGEFIQDRSAAIALGKALFWDSQVGSDSITACATCHFHAGADNRSKNQLSPGLLAHPTDTTFQVGGPNYTLQTTDFPFHKLKNVNDRRSRRLRSFNDVASSQGVILETFLGLDEFNEEIRVLERDPVFQVNGINTRRVEPRNTPSVINAVFNARNFWDGRAQAVFNGVNPFGLRDSELADSDLRKAFVWKAEQGWLVEVRVALDNSSLASQAVGPPLSAFEMSAAGRRFQELGRKLLDRRALANQEVHPEDSVLGTRIDPLTRRMTATYRDLIKAAFQTQWWGSKLTVPADAPSAVDEVAPTTGSVELAANPLVNPKRQPPRPEPAGWTHMEANFSLYFGLALQLYQSTLVSDQTPYDRHAEGSAKALTSEQKLGLDLFLTKGQCVNCHGGPEFTNASVAHARHNPLERMLMGNQQQAVYDDGFYNIGVRPTPDDVGVGGQDPFGNPLSESRLAQLRGREVFKLLTGRYPNLEVSPTERVAADGAFKTPTLRNIELTAPYFHNGGNRTLLEVVEFYNRGGDFFDENIADVDADIGNLGLTNKEKAALVAFLKALTDERVRYRQAPFDHPALYIPNGHQGDAVAVINDGSGAAMDTFTLLPATGRNGGVPFRNFLE